MTKFLLSPAVFCLGVSIGFITRPILSIEVEEIPMPIEAENNVILLKAESKSHARSGKKRQREEDIHFILLKP